MPYKGVCTFKVSGSHWGVSTLLTACTLTSLRVMRAAPWECAVYENSLEGEQQLRAKAVDNRKLQTISLRQRSLHYKQLSLLQFVFPPLAIPEFTAFGLSLHVALAPTQIWELAFTESSWGRPAKVREAGSF